VSKRRKKMAESSSSRFAAGAEPAGAVTSIQPCIDRPPDTSTKTISHILARSNTVATLLPGANYFLGLGKYPPARKLIDAGVVVALATDYNPGSSPARACPSCCHLPAPI